MSFHIDSGEEFQWRSINYKKKRWNRVTTCGLPGLTIGWEAENSIMGYSNY